ncbi:hypothetical protein B0O80DRAFT_495731 [Mortierella sp. GBAus27b]|nr:hypothetical protein BGX31_000060 [Mortierella sp. GBA43]KAI8357962.1 hypothetical protein B0O80DRAFT_495731 [Mortierella sp. GBAus27b]
MSTFGEKVSNTANSYIGGAKQTVGEKLGYPDLAASGAEQKAQADAAAEAAAAKTRMEGTTHTLQGQVEQKVGEVTGDTALQAKGKAHEARVYELQKVIKAMKPPRFGIASHKWLQRREICLMGSEAFGAMRTD